MSLTDVAGAIAARQVSSLEVAEACLERIASLQPRLNCFIAVEGERALAAARQADAELSAKGARGPLHGVPLAHKDLFYRAGQVCSAGSKVLRDYVPDRTATVLARLRGAGALEMGRLNMAEFALGPTGHNEHAGHCRNPWHTGHVSGGSSSGSGAAVAARLVYGALGSDTGGSVRIPAAFCGVVGLKPTQGRVSRHGMVPVSFSLDQAGPLARTVRDCARLTAVIAGADPEDPTAATEAVPDYEAELERSVKGVRIGVPSDYFLDGAHPEVEAALAGAGEVFRALGAEPAPVPLPDIGMLQDLTNVIQSCEAAAAHRRWMAERPGEYSTQVLGRLKLGLYFPATRYLEALELRGVIAERYLDEVFAKVDALLVPTCPFPAPGLEEADVKAGPGYLEMLHGIARCTRPINFLGLPALSVPAGFSAAGLPLAFQLVGRPFGEALLFNLGHLFQRETSWHLRAPEL